MMYTRMWSRSRMVLLLLMAVVGISLLHSSCDKEDKNTSTAITITPVPPEGMNAADVPSITIVLKNTKTGKSQTATSEKCEPVVFANEYGTYSVTATGQKELTASIQNFAGSISEFVVKNPVSVHKVQLAVSSSVKPGKEGEGQDGKEGETKDGKGSEGKDGETGGTTTEPGKDSTTVEKGNVVVTLKMPTEFSALPLEGITVNLKNDKQEVVSTAKSDSKGIAKLAVAPGKYTVEALATITVGTAEKQLSSQPQEVTATKGEDTPVTLELKPATTTSKTVQYTVTATVPDEYKTLPNKMGTLTVTRAGNTPEEFTLDEEGKTTITLQEGASYTLQPVVQCLDDRGVMVLTFAKTEENVTVDSSSPAERSIALDAPTITSALVIKEVNYVGGGKPFYAQQYLEIYNNSPFTVYADGVTFSKSEGTPPNPPGPYIKGYEDGRATFAECAYAIPGSGKEHKLDPGQGMLICNQGRKNEGEGALDLSNADFEWYDKDETLDVDSPTVPNLTSIFKQSMSITILHNRGWEGWFIWKAPLGQTPEQYVQSVTFIGPNKNPKITSPKYPIDKGLIIDAVLGSDPTRPIKTKIFADDIDAGFTYNTQKGKNLVIRRKVLKTVNGRVVYQDTNNSTNDFLGDQPAQPKQYGN